VTPTHVLYALPQREVNARMRPWGDADFRRFAFRVALLRRRGLSESVAETWADRLALRDQERDDRHLCLECVHRQDDHGCVLAKQGRLPGVRGQPQANDFQFQRCEGFKWVTP
jgi:hypothetical protein